MPTKKSIIAALLCIPIIVSGGIQSEWLAHFFLIPQAHAQTVVKGAGSVPDIVGQIASIILMVFIVLNWIILALVQALLDLDVIFGEVITSGLFAGYRPMELILQNLWWVSRDIVNGIFAFILVGAGIYLIVKSSSDAMTKIKQGAPKFVLAVILVNFSWFFPRVIIDVANVLTSVVYQLPAMVDPGMPCVVDPGPDETVGTSDDEECVYVYHVKINPPSQETCDKNPADPKIQNYCPPPSSDATDYEDRGVYLWLVSIYYQEWTPVARIGHYMDRDTGLTVPITGADVVVNGLAVNFAKMKNFGKVDFEKLRTSVAGTEKFTEQAVFALRFILYLIFNIILSMAVSLALLAFAVVLIARMAVLWLCIAFMPFIFIGYALGGGLGELNLGKAQESAAPNIWQQFIKYAFLPVFVAIPLSVGFTLMSQLHAIKTFATPIQMEGLDELLNGITSLQELLWMIITIGIIWVGVFQVLQSDKLAAKITGSIKGIGEGTAKIAGKSLGYAPILPIPGVGQRGIFDVRDAFGRAARGRGIEDFEFQDRGSTPGERGRVIQRLNESEPDRNRFNTIVRTPTDGSNIAERLQQLTNVLEPMVGMEAAQRMVRNPQDLREFARNVDGINEEDVNRLIPHIDTLNTNLSHINMEPVIRSNSIPQNADAAGQQTAIALEQNRDITIEQVQTTLKAHKDFAPTAQEQQGIQQALDKVEDAIRRGVSGRLDDAQHTALIAALRAL